MSRDGLGLGGIGAHGYRAHSSVAMAPMFKGIRFGRHHFQTCSVGTDHGYGYGYETMGTGTRPWVWVRVQVRVRGHGYGYGYGL